MSARPPPRPSRSCWPNTANGSAPAAARALGPFKQGVLVLCWFLDGTRPAQLATGDGVERGIHGVAGVPTPYARSPSRSCAGSASTPPPSPASPGPPSSCSSSSTAAPPERRLRTVTRRYREGFTDTVRIRCLCPACLEQSQAGTPRCSVSKKRHGVNALSERKATLCQLL